MTRTRLAFIVSPLVAVVTVWAGGYGYSLIQAEKPPPGGAASHALLFFLLFGAPVAYAVAAIIGIPLFRWFARTNRLRFLPIVSFASLTGMVVFTGVWALFWGSLDFEPFTFSLGAVAGGLTGLTFRFIVGRSNAVA